MKICFALIIGANSNDKGVRVGRVKIIPVRLVEAFAGRWQHRLETDQSFYSATNGGGEAVWRRIACTVDCTTLRWFSAACNFALERRAFSGKTVNELDTDFLHTE